MEAYKVWVTLNLRGDAHKKMEQFLSLVRKTTKEVDKLLKSMDKFNINFQVLSGTLNKTNPEIKIFNTNIHQSINVMNSASISATRLSNSLTKVYMASQKANRGGHRGGFIHGALLGVGARHVAGLGAAAAGFGVVHTIGSAFHTGSEFQKEMTVLNAQNIPGLSKEAINKFLNSTKVRGASRLDLLEALADAAVITKGSQEALGVAPALAKMKVVGSGLGKEGFKMTPKQLQAAIKTVEIVSKSRDPKVLEEYLGMMTKTWISTGGRVEPSQYQSIVRSSRGYAAGMDPKFFFYMLEPLIQEFGTRTGPMIAQFYQHMRVGRVTTQAAQLLGQMGLADPNAVQLNKMGMIKGIAPGGIKGMDVAGKNIFEWIDKFLMPAMNKSGYKTPEQQMGVLGKIFTNTDLTLILTYLQQREKFLASAKVNENSSEMDKLIKDLNDIHSGKMQQTSAAFRNFALSLDKITGPIVDAGLATLTRIFNVLDKLFSLIANTGASLGTDYSKQSLSNTLNNGNLNSGYPSVFNRNITSPTPGSSANQSAGNVYLDSEKVGRVVFSKANSQFNPIVQHGTTAINGVSSPFSNAVNVTGLVGQ
ncbi:MAG TPA: hypothetical protein VGW78_07490 [Candidatus Babeliales bacterium]|jgi:hypothetical protein|nr:hypothetical protein [Candidatus Babeliales bacterium]